MPVAAHNALTTARRGRHLAGRPRLYRPACRPRLAAGIAIVFLLFPVYLFVCTRCWAAQLTLSTPRPGGVFYAGETVRLSLTAPAQMTVSCSVHDHSNRQWATRTETLPAGRPAELLLGKLPPGWYRLQVRAADQLLLDDAFCVIRRYRGLGVHDGLFGACTSIDSQDLADFFSLAGIHAVRRDWGWPTVEPYDDVWRPEAIQGVMARARAAGLDFLPILGYAPGFVRRKPIDATSGRPSLAGHAWPISDKREWVEYLRWCKDFAASLPPVKWPSPRLDPDARRRISRPAVAGWEIWNEADQNFYYGPWHQYCDLLRLAYAVLDDADTPVINGASCGHWTEMGMALGWGMRPFFDFSASHPGGEVDESMCGWLYGAPSIAYKFGAPFALNLTEAYFGPPDDTTSHAEYVPVLFAKLRHFDVTDHYCSQLVGPSTTIKPDTRWFFYRLPQGISPSPSYVAAAFSRWLMVDAAYAGRLKIGENIEAFVFVRLGRPVMLLWNAGSPARVTVRVQSGARLLDHLGRLLAKAPVTQLSFVLGRAPRVVLGCSWQYVADAARARFDEYLGTQFGIRAAADRWSSYVSKLEADARALAPAAVAELRAAADQAFAALAAGPSAARMVRRASGYARRLLLALRPASPAEACQPQRYNTIWRVCALAEWLSELADDVQLATGRRLAFSRVHSRTRRVISVAWAEAVNASDGTEKFRARNLVRRAMDTARRAERLRGTMLSFTARVEARVARAVAAYETPQFTRLVAFAEFPDAPFVVKGQLVQPGRPLTIRLLVCNQTPRDVSLTVRVRCPGGWEPATASRTATVEAWSVQEIGTVTVTPLADGEWEQKSSWRPASPLQVFCPANVPANQEVEVWAEVAGRATLHCHYFFNVGSLTRPEPQPQPEPEPQPQPGPQPPQQPPSSPQPPAPSQPTTVSAAPGTT